MFDLVWISLSSGFDDNILNCLCLCVTVTVVLFFVLQISIQRILLAVCERAAGTTNGYERHRILLMYHLFVNLLLREVKDGLGGAWAFVLRDIIYTLIHHINSRLVHTNTHMYTCSFTHTASLTKTNQFVFFSHPQISSLRRGF